jgi:hypothetical protein
MMLLPSPVILGVMEKRFEILRESRPIPVGSVAERIMRRLGQEMDERADPKEQRKGDGEERCG